MRRFLFILFLCAHWIARGQTLYEYRYWFDGDETTLQTGTATGQTWQMDLDVSNLEETFHQLYIQVKDTAGVWSSPQMRYFVRLPMMEEAVMTYWFDTFTDKKQTVSLTDGVADIDASALTDGMHLLHVMVNGADSPHGSITKTALFLKQPILKQCKYRLWVDEDKSTMQEGLYTGQPVELNVENISEGFHLLHAQVEGATASSPLTSMFIKVPQVIGVEYLTTLFFVDGKEYKQEQLPTEGGVVKWTFDVSDISHGVHKASAMIVTPTGAASGLKETFFYRAMTTAEKNSMRCFYSVDGSPHKYEAGKMENNLYHFDLNMADIPDGFHRLSYMLMGENGTSSKVMSTFFIKTPIGGNGVMQYDYWLNENEENMKKVKLEKRENPFKLISLLPVESCPIRSSSFHFETENGNPMIYAKNDFHVRFYDAAGRVTEASKSYVDYAVSRPVEDIEPITDAEGIINCDRPEENGILWFKTEAKIGDSLAIKTNLAASLQIFSPSGKEVYAANGAEAVKFSGCHAYEDGTYYIALHDIAATSGTTIDFHYQHIDKYAVLKSAPAKVGISSKPFSLLLYGNGMEKLAKAEIKDNGRLILSTDSIVVATRSLCEAVFTFNEDVQPGTYDVVLTFKDGDKEDLLASADAIVLEEGFEGEVLATISSKRTLASPYPVYITLKNTGNVRKRNMNVIFGYENVKGLESVSFENFSIGLDDLRNVNGMDEISYMDSLLNATVVQAAVQTIEPDGEVTLVLGLTGNGHTKTNMYALVGPEMEKEEQEAAAPKMVALSSVRLPNGGSGGHWVPSLEHPGCYKWVVTPAETIGSIAMGETAGSIASGNTGETAGSIGMGNFGSNTNTIAYQTGETAGSIANGDGGSVVASQGMKKPRTSAAINATPRNGGGLWCPDPPPPIPIEILVPGDPNDIIGYKSEADTTFIRKNLTDVFYNIEFENDPDLATASAHDIVVVDTLTPKHFDLKSYKPTGIKIGSVHTPLTGEQEFVRTIDLRPAINVIAEVRAEYDAMKGIATWRIASLDPMTMEKTDNPMSGVLPINYDGVSGQGEISFDIKLKDNLDDGVEIHNRAAIIFDQEEPIITPTWTNVMDTIAPVSQITTCEAVNDSTVMLHFKGTDNRSGVWKYDLYRQDGTDAPWVVTAENITDSVYTFEGYTGLSYGFCVMATDSAGNKEVKELIREATQITYKKGDANSDGVVNTTDAMLAIDKYLGNPVYLNSPATDVNDDGIINTADAMLIQDIYLTTASKAKKIVLRRRLKTTKQ